MAVKTNTVEYINSRAADMQAFVDEYEKKFNAKIEKIAKQVALSERSEIIMIAGPSSSGKTTSAKKLRLALEKRGFTCYTISLDDFYLNNSDAPRFPDGSPDFETVDALDIKYFQKTMRSLLEKGEGDLPEFDFLTGMRKKEYNHITVTDRDVIIVEGLHALNPVITEGLPADRLLKIYINVSTRIYDKNRDMLFNKRNMRFIRRMVRDYRSRGNSVEDTFRLWISVRYGEDAYLFPYKGNADIRINTLHLYETCVLKDEAIKLLSEVSAKSEFYKEAQRLIRNLKRFESIDTDCVPDDSLLREFIGRR